jgi:hypothetical protein
MELNVSSRERDLERVGEAVAGDWICERELEACWGLEVGESNED